MKAFDDATFVLYGLSEYTVWDAIINYKTFVYISYVSYIAYNHFIAEIVLTHCVSYSMLYIIS